MFKALAKWCIVSFFFWLSVCLDIDSIAYNVFSPVVDSCEKCDLRVYSSNWRKLFLSVQLQHRDRPFQFLHLLLHQIADKNKKNKCFFMPRQFPKSAAIPRSWTLAAAWWPPPAPPPWRRPSPGALWISNNKKTPTKVIYGIAFFISLEITRSQVRQRSQEKDLC